MWSLHLFGISQRALASLLTGASSTAAFIRELLSTVRQSRLNTQSNLCSNWNTNSLRCCDRTCYSSYFIQWNVSKSRDMSLLMCPNRKFRYWREWRSYHGGVWRWRHGPHPPLPHQTAAAWLQDSLWVYTQKTQVVVLSVRENGAKRNQTAGATCQKLCVSSAPLKEL